MHAEEVLIPLSMFATVFGIVYLYYSTRNKERMALIDKGLDVSIFAKSKHQLNLSGSLKLGILGIGVSLGILIGYFLSEVAGLPEPVAFLSMVFLFGGLSLISFYIIAQKERMLNKD